MKEQNYIGLPFMPDVRAIAEQNNVALERVFKGRIKGRFLIDIKDQVMKDLGLESLLKYLYQPTRKSPLTRSFVKWTKARSPRQKNLLSS